MNSVSGARYFWVKYLVAAAIMVSALFLGACGPKLHMIAKEGKPSITAKSNKAVLVIIRTTAFGWGAIVDNYLDGKMIGQTEGKVFFVTEVTPGRHYVISHADNTDTARLNFEAGKIYPDYDYFKPIVCLVLEAQIKYEFNTQETIEYLEELLFLS